MKRKRRKKSGAKTRKGLPLAELARRKQLHLQLMRHRAKIIPKPEELKNKGG
jgi:hypothetical protein